MRRRAGFTLVELLASMTILFVITVAAVQFLRRQTGSVDDTSFRMEALQNAEFGVSQIDRELREAGAGVVDAQPMMVQLDSEAMTFNANMVSIDSGDVRAVYQLADGDTAAARGMLKTERMPLPNSAPAKYYPDTTYSAAKGVPSGAETISYYLVRDSAATAVSRYILYRRVNARPPTVVARNIVKNPAQDTMPFFTYYRTDTTNKLVVIPKSRLPLYHAQTHGSTADTGASALTDSVRAVRLHFLAASRDFRTGKDSYRPVDALVRLLNAGLLHVASCGLPPLGPSSVSVTSSVASPPGGVHSVTIAWSAAMDDNLTGEKDIERYAIFRRRDTDPAFGDPISSIPAGKASYSFVDTAVLPGATYVYGVASQDCTPTMSNVTSSTAVVVNP
ncbi:MAG: hypothetical protein JWN53_199 [Gemmatimonadetes bacterium]|jgi:type II secretory pathway pseudopilin PulG|nr:hypothetical protein [Gemmatimonadota bacterium]